MDCSWLHDDEVEPSSDSESDPEQTRIDLEARLYSIVHHNDLSQPLPPDLAKHYTVQCDDDGEVVVTLNNSLEDLKSEECEKVNNIFKNSEFNNENLDRTVEQAPVDDDVVIISQVINTQEPQNVTKRFRYSDVNLNIESKLNEKIQSTTRDINYFKFNPGSLASNKFKPFMDLVIPLNHNFPNWKSDANASYISIEPSEELEAPEVIQKIFQALKKANPNVKNKRLNEFAQLLYSQKKKAFKRRENKVRKKANKHGVSVVDLSQEGNNFFNNPFQNHVVNDAKSTPKLKNKEVPGGCISLNISPFRPNTPTIVLDSHDENDSSVNSVDRTPKRLKKTPELKSHFPTKWSKSMIHFYNKPAERKFKKDINAIINELKRTTVAEDWKVDPRDLKGYYQRSPMGKYTRHRCMNCFERGHMPRDCPKPKKIPTCSSCGEYYHSVYSCPNKICLKCGVDTPNEIYGGECSTCYYNTFNYSSCCEICGEKTHVGYACPDIWRSFHATTGGKKKIPAKVNINNRRYCCNCAQQGHFLDDCPSMRYTWQRSSSFVKNYSTERWQKGTTEFVLPHVYTDIINSRNADEFFQGVSNSTSAVISYEQLEMGHVFRISGTFEQCNKIKSDIEGYINTRKRKRQDPVLQRKRQKVR